MSLGKFQFTAKTWVIVIIVAALIVCGIGYALSQQPSTKTKIKESETITVTVKNNIGIEQIEVVNLNTGKHFIFSLTTTQRQFNCTRGDYLQYRVIVADGFEWNGWWFNPMDIFDDDNPAIIAADDTNAFGNIVSNNEIVMVPNCLILPATPSPSPSPAPTSTSFTPK